MKRCEYKGKYYLPGERILIPGKILVCRENGTWQEKEIEIETEPARVKARSK